jgi:hypothetical protein
MNYIKLIKGGLWSLALLMAVGCDGDDTSLTNISANFAQLDGDSSVILPENSGTSLEIMVILGGPRATATQIEFDITGDASRYVMSAPSLSIPAGDTSGSLLLTALDNDDIDGDVDVVVTLSSSSSLPIGIGGDGVSSVNKTIKIVDDNVPCNDILVDIIPDDYPEETSWEITDQADGSVVVSGTTGQVNVNLPDGCYTFIIFDTFGDGICCDYGSGSYSVTCGSLVHANGGAFGDSESTVFCVNQ